MQVVRYPSMKLRAMSGPGTGVGTDTVENYKLEDKALDGEGYYKVGKSTRIRLRIKVYCILSKLAEEVKLEA